MTGKPLVPSAQARRDIDNAVDYYAREAGRDVARSFILELEAAYAFIAAQPALGSPRYEHELALPGLRNRKLKRYPYLVFYIEGDAHIDIARVLHNSRDIGPSLAGPTEN